MTRSANYFLDPATSETYAWPLNHNEEEEVSKQRSIEHTAPTSGVGLIRQQGDEDPLVFKLSGHILTYAQVRKFITFYNRCRSRTIYWVDWTGDTYEVLITRFAPKRVRTQRNARDLEKAPDNYWSYTLEMEVVRVVDAIWDGAAP